MSESTDRTSIDSQQLIPRVHKTGETTVTTNNSVGSYVNGSVVVNQPNIARLAAISIDAYVKDGSSLWRMPHYTYNSSGQILMETMARVSPGVINGKDVLTLHFSVMKRGGSTSDTYPIYYVIYTTRWSDTDPFA